jgi:hypothetical protein
MGRRAHAAGGILVVLALAPACGGDGGHDRADYVAVLSGGSAEGLSDEESECGAEVIVDVVGVDALEEADAFDKIQDEPDGSLADYGVELDEAQLAELGQGVSGCFDARAVFQETLTSGGQVSPELASCVLDAIDDASFERLLAISVARGEAALDTDPELSGMFEQAAADCASAGVT